MCMYVTMVTHTEPCVCVHVDASGCVSTGAFIHSCTGTWSRCMPTPQMPGVPQGLQLVGVQPHRGGRNLQIPHDKGGSQDLKWGLLRVRMGRERRKRPKHSNDFSDRGRRGPSTTKTFFCRFPRICHVGLYNKNPHDHGFGSQWKGFQKTSNLQRLVALLTSSTPGKRNVLKRCCQ